MLIRLNNLVIVEFGPLKDVLFTHNIWVNEQIAVTHTEVLLTGRTFEALQMVNLVPNTHGHLECSNPLLTGSAETVLTKKPVKMRKKAFTELLCQRTNVLYLHVSVNSKNRITLAELLLFTIVLFSVIYKNICSMAQTIASFVTQNLL